MRKKVRMAKLTDAYKDFQSQLSLIDDYEHDLGTRQTQLDELVKDREKLNYQLHLVREKIELSRDVYRQELDNYLSNRDRILLSIAELQDELTLMKQSINDASTEIADLRQKKDSLSRQKRELSGLIRSTKLQIKDIKREIKHSQSLAGEHLSISQQASGPLLHAISSDIRSLAPERKLEYLNQAYSQSDTPKLQS